MSGATVGGSAVSRTELRTRDGAVAAATADAIAEHRARITVRDPSAVAFRISSANAEQWGADVVGVEGVRYVTEGAPIDYVLAGALVHGRVLLRSRRDEVRLSEGDGFMYPIGAEYHCDCIDPGLANLRMPLSYIARIAEETTGIPAAALRFQSLSPVSAPMRRYWSATLSFIAGQMNAAPTAPDALIAGQLLRLGAAAALVAFPNTSMAAGLTGGAGPESSAVVRRARAFIDAYAERPLTVTEIACAAGVGPRTVQLAFRRHLDTTPMAYLRRVRLERAHRDLRNADPAGKVTVAATARRWGWTSASRFAGEYRQVFHELPSHTLRS
ncbi:helix-turn-helix transcriptional regulator [Actinoplanes sp. N902-109]|uniref:helix-turn-helix transcriptional regulator n=1 Tax=Actinoplanes sp. (strain N902-109) TaxID=649831 RepID=UPI000684CC8D|nr:helix-turn-helix transcriptional regulator [Actinoplanes sp. N902-109]